jgi:hypothetical protein
MSMTSRHRLPADADFLGQLGLFEPGVLTGFAHAVTKGPLRDRGSGERGLRHVSTVSRTF